MLAKVPGSWRRIRAHAGWELRLLLRNGEQLLLVFIIPIALLVGLNALRATWLGPITPVPTVLAVAILATAFTSLAIGTGFERRSGALEFLGTTPLTRVDLLVGKLGATVCLTAVSMASIVGVGLMLGWQPSGEWAAAVLVALLGVVAAGSWAIAMAGALRAEAVLALANGIFVLLVMFGGVIIPASAMPAAFSAIVPYLPSGALADGLRSGLAEQAWPWLALAVLCAWSLAGILLARRTFRWQP